MAVTQEINRVCCAVTIKLVPTHLVNLFEDKNIYGFVCSFNLWVIWSSNEW